MAYKDKAVASLISALDDEACTAPNARLEMMLVGKKVDDVDHFRLKDENGVEIKTIDDLIPHIKLDNIIIRPPMTMAKVNDQYSSSRVLLIIKNLKFTINDTLECDKELARDFGHGDFRLSFLCAYFNDNDIKTRLKILMPNLHCIGGMHQ